MALLVDVDDIVIIGPNIQAIDSLKTFLHSQFKLKDLSSLKYFLGIEIAHSQSVIVISQRNYALQLLEDSGYLDYKPSSNPMDPKISLSNHDGDLLTDTSHYRRLIGRLIHLTLHCPDITFAIQKLSQILSQPRMPHLKAVHHLLRYLKGCPGQGLFFPALSDPQSLIRVRGLSDSDWGSCLDIRKSTSSFCIFLGKSLVSWKAKHRSTIFCSLAVAEYMALAATVNKIIWIN